MNTPSKIPAEEKIVTPKMNKNVIIYFTIAMLIWWGGLQTISGQQNGDHSLIVVILTVSQALLYKFWWPNHEFSWIGLLTGLIPILLAVVGLSDNPFTPGVLLYFAAGTWIYWWWAKA